MRRITFQFKLSIIFILLLFIILLVTSYLIYEGAIDEQKEGLRSRILALTELSAMLIDADKLIQIKPELQSQGTALYKEVKETLGDIRNKDPLIDSVYTMIKSGKENIWIFLVDSGDKRGVSAYCSEPYDVSGIPEMKLAFDGPRVDRELSRDKYGIFLSGYAPLYNKQGEAVAIIGLDVSAESIQNMQLLLTKRFLWVLIAGIIFSLLMSWLVARAVTKPLRSLMLGVNEVGKGNFRHKVVVKTKDELYELAAAFNKMTDDLQETHNKLQRLYIGTIKSLAQALEAKDPYTKGHSDRVSHYAVNIGKRLGMDEKDIKLLEEVCLFHDIGKIGTPKEILNKVGKLTDEEWRIIREHPKTGEDILKHIEFLRSGLSIVSDHHERPDGKGYPHALRAGEISLLASIVAVADSYDAMTSDRPYRKALSQEEAIKILKENKDTQFNSRAVDVFIEYLQRNTI